MSLVTWITVTKYLLYLLYLYVNNSFSAQRRGERLFYKHYQKELPEERKQVFGNVLPIIGFEVDPI